MVTRNMVAIALVIAILWVVTIVIVVKYYEPGNAPIKEPINVKPTMLPTGFRYAPIYDPVLEAVSDLKADIAKLNDEIAELRKELYEHDNRPEWFERKEDD